MTGTVQRLVSSGVAIVKHDDFIETLDEHKRRFREKEGRDPVTVKEFEDFLRLRRASSKTRHLKSLKGFSF